MALFQGVERACIFSWSYCTEIEDNQFIKSSSNSSIKNLENLQTLLVKRGVNIIGILENMQDKCLLICRLGQVVTKQKKYDFIKGRIQN